MINCRLDFPRESLGILGDDERDEQESDMYEKERTQGKNHPNILASDPYKQFQVSFMFGIMKIVQLFTSHNNLLLIK